MKDQTEIGKGLDEIHWKGKTIDGESDVFIYKPHPDYPFVDIEIDALDTAHGRLDSFMGVKLPRAALMQIVAAYISASSREDMEDERKPDS